MDTKVLTAHVPLALAERIDDYSAHLQRSRGWIVKQALEAWVAAQEGGNMTRQFGSGFSEAAQKFDFGTGKPTAAGAVEALLALRQTTTLGDITWQELRDAGRR